MSQSGAMQDEELELRKKEYYELVERSSLLKTLLNENGGLLIARSGGHPWPARFAEPGEFAKMSSFRKKGDQACVYFFGTRNYGWVPQNQLKSFTEDPSAYKSNKKYTPVRLENGLEEAKLVLETMDDQSRRFYDHLMDEKDEPMDMPCERCNRVSDHYSLLILCDGKDCHREFHTQCLSPPLDVIPEGEWYCPECVKEQARKQKASQSDTTSKPVVQKSQKVVSGPMPTTSSSSSGKKQKKDKGKSYEKSLKRRLPSAPMDEEESYTPPASVSASKKAKGQVLDAAPTRKSAANGSKKADGGTEEMSDSDERCFICGYGGEVIVCDFLGCPKVYHQFCLGSFPIVKGENTPWYCPRHMCVLTGTCESVEERSSAAPVSGKTPSPRRFVTKYELWKCSKCPVAIDKYVLPPIPSSQKSSKRAKTFVCPHCHSSAALKIQLGKLLEKIWSTMATNRQGIPLYSPLLPGIDGDVSDYLPRPDLFKLLIKIRRLEYNSSSEFLEDVDALVSRALAIVGSRSPPLAEAAQTIKIICREQWQSHKSKLDAVETKLRRAWNNSAQEQLVEDHASGSWGNPKWPKRWPIRWREELGRLDKPNTGVIGAKSLDEWTAFVTSAAMYATVNDSSDNESTIDAVPQFMVRNPEDTSEVQSTPLGGLTLSEGTDVMTALTALSRRKHDQSSGLEGNDLDEVDGRELFLSPSMSEMQHMFDQQSERLRQALEAHSTLRRAWALNQKKVLGADKNSELTVGEGRLAAELRLANKNLRARLQSKDQLVDQLTQEQSQLYARLKSMETELASNKQLVEDLRRQARHGASNRLEDKDADGLVEHTTFGKEVRPGSK